VSSATVAASVDVNSWTGGRNVSSKAVHTRHWNTSTSYSMDEEALIAAVLNNKDDAAPRLVLADLYLERGNEELYAALTDPAAWWYVRFCSKHNFKQTVLRGYRASATLRRYGAQKLAEANKIGDKQMKALLHG
jgi:uncharacterized protein (TIGR02996 family)